MFSNSVNNLDTYYSLRDHEVDFSKKLKKSTLKKIQEVNYPIARLTKSSFFCNEKLKIDPGVFIPRTETELLVGITLDWIKKLNLNNFSYIDLCTGSGAIFTSILDKNQEKLTKTAAIDTSWSSCKNTIKNLNLKTKKINSLICLSDWEKFLRENPNWDVITMNPPYLGKEELINLSNSLNLLKYDPKWALQASLNGWAHYLKIIEFALKNIYWKLIVLECNESHETSWDGLNLNCKDFVVNKYWDHLGKFRIVVLSRV